MTTAFIFARGGSKRLPGKNLMPLAGRSLVSRAVQHGIDCPMIDRVIISTDSDALAAEALRTGADHAIARPAELASDRANEWMAWQHAVDWAQDRLGLGADECFVSLPPTAPLRTAGDIANALDLHASSGADIVVTGSKAVRHPRFNLVRRNPQTGPFVTRYDDPGDGIADPNGLPEAFDLTTVAYVTTFGFVLSAKGVFDGTVALCEVSRESAIDIDTALDFRLAEILIAERETMTENEGNTA